MRLLACGLLTGWLALGCSTSADGTGAGGHGGASSTATASSASGAPSITSGPGAGGSVDAESASSSSSATSSTGTTSSTSTASSSTASGAGGSMSAGDCQSDVDCKGASCVEVTPGGFRVCLDPLQKATACGNPGVDQCCAGMPCPSKEPCYLGPLVPFCAGVSLPPHNQCAVDQCSADVDCAAGQICGLAGTLGLEIRACISASCKVDGDCAAPPGGLCAPVREPCCGTTAGLYCIYPSAGGCRSDGDCPPTTGHPHRYCAPDAISGIASCQDGAPVCPA